MGGKNAALGFVTGSLSLLSLLSTGVASGRTVTFDLRYFLLLPFFWKETRLLT